MILFMGSTGWHQRQALPRARTETNARFWSPSLAVGRQRVVETANSLSAFHTSSSILAPTALLCPLHSSPLPCCPWLQQRPPLPLPLPRRCSSPQVTPHTARFFPCHLSPVVRAWMPDECSACPQGRDMRRPPERGFAAAARWGDRATARPPPVEARRNAGRLTISWSVVGLVQGEGW